MGDHAAYISADCPLVWLNASFGFLAVVLVLILTVCIFWGMYQLIKMKRENGQESGELAILTFALCIRTVLALAANVFLITTSDVGILMMGNAYDIIPLMFFLTAGAETGTRGEKVTAR